MTLRPNLHSIALVTPTDSVFLVGDGTNWVGESGATAQASLGLGSIATQAANNVNIDGGAIDGTTIGASSAAAGTFTTVTTSGEIGVGGASSTGYLIVGHQLAHAKGYFLWGYDDQSGKYIDIRVLATGAGSIASNGGFEFGTTGQMSFNASTDMIIGAATHMYADIGGLFVVRDADGSYAHRATINSATGELSVISDTVGLKLGASGGQTLYSNGTNFMFAGGDIDANGSTIFFGAAENVATPAAGNSNTVTINLGAENHHTLDCATSASGAVTANLTVPPGPCGGTIIVKLGAVGITWAATSGTLRWCGTQPTWDTVGDDGKWIIVSWRWDATNLFLSATGTTA